MAREILKARISVEMKRVRAKGLALFEKAAVKEKVRGIYKSILAIQSALDAAPRSR